MPIPLGVLETGGFADGIDPATIQQLKAQGAGGSVPKDIIKAKGESDAAHFGMVGGELNAELAKESRRGQLRQKDAAGSAEGLDGAA